MATPERAIGRRRDRDARPEPGLACAGALQERRLRAEVAKPFENQNVAITLDQEVESAPRIYPGITGQDVQITGNFTESEARTLALVLGYGALPFHLEYVSATPEP